MEGEKCGVSDPVPVGYTIYGIIVSLDGLSIMEIGCYSVPTLLSWL